MKFKATNKAIKAGARVDSCCIRKDGVVIELLKAVKVEGEWIDVRLVHLYSLGRGVWVNAQRVTKDDEGRSKYADVYGEEDALYVEYGLIANGVDTLEVAITTVKVEDVTHAAIRVAFGNEAQRFTMYQMGFLGAQVYVGQVGETWERLVQRQRRTPGVLVTEFDDVGKVKK
jgi:hypothetical protein